MRTIHSLLRIALSSSRAQPRVSRCPLRREQWMLKSGGITSKPLIPSNLRTHRLLALNQLRRAVVLSATRPCRPPATIADGRRPNWLFDTKQPNRLSTVPDSLTPSEYKNASNTSFHAPYFLPGFLPTDKPYKNQQPAGTYKPSGSIRSSIRCHIL